MNLIKAISHIDSTLRHEHRRGNREAEFIRKRLPEIKEQKKSFENYLQEAFQKMNSKQITFELLDSIPANMEFKGIELQKKVCHTAGQVHYPDTILRYMREWRKHNPDFDIVLISKPKSIYKKVKKA